jgi:uncharacterized protein (DUF697 family)/GTP-binding protein EngB required for normal cell division
LADKINLESLENARAAFLKELDRLSKSKKRPTILVCGYMGVGKTSLIQSVLGKDVVSDDKIVHGRPGTKNFDEFSSEFIRIYDSRGFEPGISENQFISDITDFVRNKQESSNVDDHIHLVWYCISGANARISKSDIKLIKYVFPYKRVQVVITKNDITREIQRNALINELTSNGVDEQKITFLSDTPSDKGVSELVNKSLRILPNAYKDAFISKQQVDLDAKKAAATKIINRTSISAGLWGIIPFADLIVILPIQLQMAAAIADVYGFDSKIARDMAGTTGIITAVSSSLLSVTLLDLIPVFGQVLSAVTVGSITVALGNFISDYFYKCNEFIINGGSVDEIKPINADNVIEYIKKYVSK